MLSHIIMASLSILILLIIVQLYYVESSPTVRTRLGKIKGHYRNSRAGNRYEAYEGIPYALPPTGQRRFMPPQPIEQPWTGELIANKFAGTCIGHGRNRDAYGSYVAGDEDCLYLNVYVPLSRPANDSLPVIFWLYGGAFQVSTLGGDEQGFLIDHDVVVVTLNYRHGALGFMSTEDGVVSGNMGLKDQAVALRWVHENIEYFGGDPKRVTLTGLSAGGASVHYHYLSPMSRGLFHSGISFSGTAFDCWTQTQNSREKAIKLSQLMNCTSEDSREMVDCLRKLPAAAIVKAQAAFMPWHLNEFTPFGPVVEKFTDQPFIDRSPIDIITSGDAYDVPWITGVVSEEGLYPVGELANNASAFVDLDENWETIAPHLLNYYYTIPREDQAKVANKIREYYFGDKPITRENMIILTHMVGDRIFIADAEKAALAQAKANKSPVWFYYYSYRAKDSLTNPMTNSTENFGVSHADDVLLVVGNDFVNPTKSKRDLAMQNDLIKLWTSVARYGVPNFEPSWSELDETKEELNFLHIAGPGDLKQKTAASLGNRQFWDSIDFQENKSSGKIL